MGFLMKKNIQDSEVWSFGAESSALHRAGLQLTLCVEIAALKCCCFVFHFLGINQCQPTVSTHQKLGKDFMARTPNIKFIYWNSQSQVVDLTTSTSSSISLHPLNLE